MADGFELAQTVKRGKMNGGYVFDFHLLDNARYELPPAVWKWAGMKSGGGYMGKVPKENNPRHYVGLVGFNHDYHQGYNF